MCFLIKISCDETGVLPSEYDIYLMNEEIKDGD